MVQPAPVDYLQPDEEPLQREGRHPLSVIDEIIAASILAAIPIAGVLVLALGFYPELLKPVAVPVIAVVLVLLAIFLLSRYWRVKTSVYIITDERVYKAHGRLRFFGSQTTYDKLTDMHVKQSIFGRWKGFGTVRLETAGTGIALEGVRDPFGFKQRVEDARFAFLHTLLDEQPARPRTQDGTEGEAPSPRGESRILWEGHIAGVSLISGLIPAGLLIFLALGGALGTLLIAPEFSILPLVLGAIGGLMIASLVIRYRFTRFFVGTRGVTVTSGWLTRRRVETTYDKVTDVTVYQGLLGRLMDFGTITVNTAGSNTAPVIFMGVAAPEQVKETIDDARRAWEAR